MFYLYVSVIYIIIIQEKYLISVVYMIKWPHTHSDSPKKIIILIICKQV